MASGLKQLLRWLRPDPMRQGVTIPPDARVDPTGFPEDEFPLRCPTCDYLLLGLPEDRCPECGHAFDRGRLLVEQYVVNQGAPHQPQSFWITPAIAVLFMLALPVLLTRTLGRWMSGRTPPWPFALSNLVEIAVITIFLALTTAMGRRCIKIRSAQAKRVWDALDHNTASFQTARRENQILTIGWTISLICMVVAFASHINESTTHSSYGLLDICILVVCSSAVGVVVYLIARLKVTRRKK